MNTTWPSMLCLMIISGGKKAWFSGGEPGTYDVVIKAVGLAFVQNSLTKSYPYTRIIIIPFQDNKSMIIMPFGSCRLKSKGIQAMDLRHFTETGIFQPKSMILMRSYMYYHTILILLLVLLPLLLRL